MLLPVGVQVTTRHTSQKGSATWPGLGRGHATCLGMGSGSGLGSGSVSGSGQRFRVSESGVSPGRQESGPGVAVAPAVAGV